MHNGVFEREGERASACVSAPAARAGLGREQRGVDLVLEPQVVESGPVGAIEEGERVLQGARGRGEGMTTAAAGVVDGP